MRTQVNYGVELCSAVEHYLASLVAKRDYAGVVRYYEDNRSDLEAAGGAPAGATLRHAAIAHSHLGHYQVALRIVRLAQNKASTEGDTVLLAEIFLTLGSVLRNIGELKEAEKAFRDAESIFRRKDHREGRSRALNLLAGLFFRQRDFKGALKVLLEAVDMARELGDTEKLSFMMGNLGRLYSFTGDFPQAKRHLSANVQLSEQLGDSLEAARAYLSLGYVFMIEGDYQKAEELLGKACQPILDQKALREEVIYLTYLGELRYRTGALEDARSTLEDGLAKAERIARASTLTGRVRRQLAEVYVLLKQYPRAERQIRQALPIVEGAGDTVEKGALLKLKAIVSEAQSKAEQARLLFAHSLEVLDSAGVRFEKAEALVAAGQSTLFSSRQRLTYLFRAEEFLSSARLMSRLQIVERLIQQIDYCHTPDTAGTTPKQCQERNNTDFTTNCPAIERFKAQLAVVAKSDMPVLLLGETGVGKDRMAGYYHSIARPNGPFVVVNCASLPETLLESELFGYMKGAFTGADCDKQGRIAAANGGVLFLDEIGDMPPALQAKLLGVLENRKVTPLGTTQELELDFKLVVATNRNLEDMVEQGTFRRDLYYRISAISFSIPPLRERREDIPLLLSHFLADCQLLDSGENLSAELVRMFMNHDWPGNTRELLNKVKRLEVTLAMASDGDLVELSRNVFATETTDANSGSLFEQVERLERQLLVDALKAAGGNKSEAARLLGIHEATVRTKLKRYGIRLEAGMA